MIRVVPKGSADGYNPFSMDTVSSGWGGSSGGSGWTSAPKVASGGGGGGAPGWNNIAGYFERALKGLTGEVEKMYQSGKRRTLSDIAMQSVNTGMANTLNLPSASIAYDEANRAQTNLGLAQARAGLTADLGRTAADVYGVNTGAQTQRYGIDVGAQTSQGNAMLDFQSGAADRALKQYLEELEMKYKASGKGGYAAPVSQSQLFG